MYHIIVDTPNITKHHKTLVDQLLIDYIRKTVAITVSVHHFHREGSSRLPWRAAQSLQGLQPRSFCQSQQQNATDLFAARFASMGVSKNGV